MPPSGFLGHSLDARPIKKIECIFGLAATNFSKSITNFFLKKQIKTSFNLKCVFKKWMTLTRNDDRYKKRFFGALIVSCKGHRL